jgi:hypothetical protein
MQTFLPYPEFDRSVFVLDDKRLGKQRVEASQIYKIVSGQRTTGGWINHPAVVMWRGYPEALALYHNACIQEWRDRGFNNTMQYLPTSKYVIDYPSWLGDNAFHASHRSNLLRKDRAHYGQFGWSESDNLPYLWPKGVNHGEAGKFGEKQGGYIRIRSGGTQAASQALLI